MMKRENEFQRLTLKKGEHLRIENHRALKYYPKHWHDYYELEIILSGEGDYVINNICYPIFGGEVCFLSSTDFHYVDIKGPTEIINIAFDEAMIENKDALNEWFLMNERAFEPEENEFSRLLSAVELLRAEVSFKGEMQTELLRYILRSVTGGKVSFSVVSGNNSDAGIKRALIFMQTHFRENITLLDLAKEAGYHPSYFSALFKKVTGENYKETLNKLRIDFAKNILRDGFSVSRAIDMSGFGSASNFNEIFKKYCGVSPTEFKKQNLT